MSDKSYKYLRIYPGLQSSNEINFKSISFQVIKDIKLKKSQLTEINQVLSEYEFDEVDSSDYAGTLAAKPLLATLVRANDIVSFENLLSPYEQVLFFIANLKLEPPPIYENISFRIFNNNTHMIIGDLRTLRINPYFPMNIYISQYQFIEKDGLMESKLLKIFTNMRSEVYQRNSNPKNDHLVNQNLVASLYWYNKACKMSEHREEKSAIIYFATAFESFFYITGPSKKDSLAFAIQRYLGDNVRLRKWINGFYDARNKIVHGSYLEREDLKAMKGTSHGHSIIAKQVFQECILRQLHITEGLDYARKDMNASYEYIVKDLLTLNKEKFRKLKDRKKYSYINIKSDEIIAVDFFKTINLININENIENRNTVKSKKSYRDFTGSLAMIVVDWLTDTKVNANVPRFHAPINRHKSGIDSIDYPKELNKIISYFDNYKPKDSKSIISIWEKTINDLSQIYHRGYPFFLSKNKPLGLYDILDFVKGSAHSLG